MCRHVSYLPPGELADAGHGEGHGGVEVPARDSARHQHAEQRAQTPAAGDKRQWAAGAGAGVLIVSDSYPQLMVKKSPFVRRDNTDWAMEAVPKQTSTKVPRLFFSQIYLDKWDIVSRI